MELPKSTQTIVRLINGREADPLEVVSGLLSTLKAKPGHIECYKDLYGIDREQELSIREVGVKYGIIDERVRQIKKSFDEQIYRRLERLQKGEVINIGESRHLNSKNKMR